MAYPPDLAEYVLSHWPSADPLLVSIEALTEVLSVCYHASMTMEEGRPTRFRLLLSEPERLPEQGAPKAGALKLLFEPSRPFSAEELRRLSPATPFETSLIGAGGADGKLRVWGIAHSGPAWLAPSVGGRQTVPVWTTDPIIHVTGPGRVAVRRAGRLIGALERGNLADTTLDVFESTWLTPMFAPNKETMDGDRSLVRTIAQHMVRRAIQLIRGARHGGMILFVEPGSLPDRSVSLKYRFVSNEPARRYRTLRDKLVARGGDERRMSWAEFASDEDPALTKLEEAIFELSRVIASLAATDGAVVLDKQFEILGFGAEVSAQLPAPDQVWQSLDVEGDDLRCDRVESVGTRHRAAYRFVRDHATGLAIVISHDGAVRFVANRGGEVVYWEQSVSP